MDRPYVEGSKTGRSKSPDDVPKPASAVGSFLSMVVVPASGISSLLTHTLSSLSFCSFSQLVVLFCEVLNL